MSQATPPVSVTIPPGFPDGLDDAALKTLGDAIAGQLIAAAAAGNLNDVLHWGELLDLARGEEHRRALRHAARQTRTSIRIAIGALAVSIATGIAGIVVALVTADY